MEPTEPRWYLNRAQYWDQKGRPELAQEDRRNAERVKRAEGNVNQGGQIP
jgi:Tfp pilus assembly protein PilF